MSCVNVPGHKVLTEAYTKFMTQSKFKKEA